MKATEKRKEAPGLALLPPIEDTLRPGWGWNQAKSLYWLVDTYFLVSVTSFVGAGGSSLSVPPPLTWDMGVAWGSKDRTESRSPPHPVSSGSLTSGLGTQHQK